MNLFFSVTIFFIFSNDIVNFYQKLKNHKSHSYQVLTKSILDYIRINGFTRSTADLSRVQIYS